MAAFCRGCVKHVRFAPMTSIQACPLPDGALLGIYQTHGAYADCYAMDAPGRS